MKYTTFKRKFLLEGSTQIKHCTEKKTDFEDSKRISSKETHKHKKWNTKKEKMTDNEHRALVAWGIIPSGLTSVTGVPEREESKGVTEKIWEKQCPKVFKVSENYKLADPRISINPK